jgi:hypothetical protein
MKSTVLRRFANFGYSGKFQMVFYCVLCWRVKGVSSSHTNVCPTDSAHNTLFFDNEESHNAPCRHSSFGLYERGPGFIIYLTNDIEKAPNNCPGVVVKGRDTLERLVRAHTNTPDGGELTWKVPIVATYLVALEDEL